MISPCSRRRLTLSGSLTVPPPVAMTIPRRSATSATLEPTEMIFAVQPKDIGDGHSAIGFDFLIEIDEGATEFRGEHLTERSFAGAHETDEDKIIFQGERSFPDRKIYNIKCDINQGRG